MVAVAGVVVLTASGCGGNDDSVALASAGSPAATFATPPQVTGTTIKVSLSSSGIAIGMDGALLVRESLSALVPVLDALRRTIVFLDDKKTIFPEKDAA